MSIERRKFSIEAPIIYLSFKQRITLIIIIIIDIHWNLTHCLTPGQCSEKLWGTHLTDTETESERLNSLPIVTQQVSSVLGAASCPPLPIFILSSPFSSR